MRLYTVAGGRKKTYLAPKEINSNGEPSSGGRPIRKLLPSLTDLADRIYHRIYPCMRLACMRPTDASYAVGTGLNNKR